MDFVASKLHLKHIAELIFDKYEAIYPQKSGGKAIYSKANNSGEILWFGEKSILPFKKFLFPNNSEIESYPGKIAFFGLPLCDIAALNLFLKQFSGSGLLPKREDILIIGGECQADENCFCDQFDFRGLLDFDLYVLKQENDFRVKTGSYKGRALADKVGIKSIKNIEIEKKAVSEKIDLKETPKNIEYREIANDFWQKIANNCFGCGACTTVCPLCFCFDQDFTNKSDGSYTRETKWTSCFSADFSQIQFGKDLRPSNSSRLYNWYHHKFVRGQKELGHPLCVGCGRCISACPAHLNIKNIIASLNHKYGSKNQK